jgi:LexA-binding, inner membrane-associated putative hydrolase
MAGFKTHVTTSTAIGIAYGAAAYVGYDVPWPSCLLAGGLCGVSGMLPDLDSGPGVPLRESVSFAAAVVPMLMIQRWQHLNLSRESIVLVSGLLYLLIRFGLGKLLRSFTVHRGMFHSLPALAIVGELAYLVCAHENPWMRCFFAVAVMCGFASHLVLDEIWSLDLKHLRVKSSFGTAVKLWGDCWWANLATYANVILLALLITQDRLPESDKPLPTKADMVATQPDDRPF